MKRDSPGQHKQHTPLLKVNREVNAAVVVTPHLPSSHTVEKKETPKEKKARKRKMKREALKRDSPEQYKQHMKRQREYTKTWRGKGENSLPRTT